MTAAQFRRFVKKTGLTNTQMLKLLGFKSVDFIIKMKRDGDHKSSREVKLHTIHLLALLLEYRRHENGWPDMNCLMDELFNFIDDEEEEEETY